jgi:hypothetical protein
MSRRSPLAASLVVAALALAASAAPASADVIRLRTGEAIKGRLIAEKSNENVLVIEDYLSGAIREIAWPAVDPTDRDVLWFDKLGLGARGTGQVYAIKGVELSVLQQGGNTITIRGVIQKTDKPKTVVLKTQTGVVEIAEDRVVGKEETDIDASDVYTPEELYDQILAEGPPQDSRGWKILAQRAEQVGAYAKAKEAWEQVAADPSTLNPQEAQKNIERLTALLKDEDALKTLRDLKNILDSGQFPKVREGIEKFPERHPEASEPVKKKVEDLKKTFEERRKTFLARQCLTRFPKTLQKLIKDKVKAKETPINDVLAWTRKELAEEAFADLAKQLQTAYDPAVTTEETKTLWDARPKRPNSWKTVGYGSGSFIVNPPQIKPPTNNRPQGGNRSGGSGPQVQFKPPPPPTRDTWWASTNERATWVLAFFVENSGLFEIDPKKIKSPCSLCLGEGLIRKALSSGGELAYLCTRCGGSQYDISIRWK